MSAPQPVQPFMPGFESEQRRRDLSQFYTPQPLAARVWSWMHFAADDITKPRRILEPSAGRGALITPVRAFPKGFASEVVAYDVDQNNVEHLATLAPADAFKLTIRARNFMADQTLRDERFDVSVMNPPFEDNQDIAFIGRATEVCTRVASICQARIVHTQGRAEFWRWHDIYREAILIERPKFGGEFNPATDFIVLDLVRRQHARKQGEASPMQVEWW